MRTLTLTPFRPRTGARGGGRAQCWRAMAASLNDFVAGIVGGCSGLLVGQPLDVIRVRLQTQVAGPTGVLPYRSTLHCAATIMQREGFAVFFRGLAPPMAGVGALNAIVFGVYGNTLRLAHGPLQDGELPSLGEVYIAGANAGLFSTVVSTPSELIKCRTQVAMSEAQIEKGMHSTWRCAQELVARHGYRSLFYGHSLTMLRDIPSFGFYFVCYEYLKRRWVGHGDGGSAGDDAGAAVGGSGVSLRDFLGLCMAGGIAGSVAWLVVYPVDVVKSKVQTQRLEAPQYKGAWDGFRQLHREAGLGVFHRGLFATILRAFPLNAITFAVYEVTLGLLDGR